MKERENISLRHFPADLLVMSGVPFAVVALFVSGIVSLQGTSWLVAFVGAMNLAVMGMILLLRAKWPLYRQGKVWTWGSRDLPTGLRKVYRIGWWLSGIGCGVAGVILAQSFLWR